MLVGYARVSTQDQKPHLHDGRPEKCWVQKDIQGEGLRRAAGPARAESRPGLYQSRGYARGLEARPAGPVFETAHRNRRGYGEAKRGLFFKQSHPSRAPRVEIIFPSPKNHLGYLGMTMAPLVRIQI